MLTRHISDSSRSSEFISLKSRTDEDVPELSKHSFVPLKVKAVFFTDIGYLLEIVGGV
jgi:hypothetical protein